MTGISGRIRSARRLVGAGALAFCAALAGPPCPAAAKSLIRDAEIEATLRRIAAPIFRAAGLGRNSVKIYIINDRDMNAFVAGGRNLFINSGMLQRLKTPQEIQAVIAHEVGHITGGHLARTAELSRGLSGAAAIGMLLAGAAAASGNGQAATAIALSTQNAAQRGFLAHSRAQEAAADQASVRYMVGAGSDPQAILDVLSIFRGQEALRAGRMDPYAQTHPLFSRRYSLLEEAVGNSPVGKPTSPELAQAHARMVAKFEGFQRTPGRVLSETPKTDTGEIATLRRAIAWHRLADRKKAAAAMARLLRLSPEDPYYHELHGQFLLENGQARAAVAAYRRATDLAPDEALLQAGLGRALLAVNSPAADRQALKVLQSARRSDGADARMLRDLALAYARAGRPADASLITAERYMLLARFTDAALHAKRAAGQFSEGSAGWLRAQDILRDARRARR
ncbi:MAG: M48 family metalloprotease [Paracoccaceae bacterium]